MRKEIIDFIEHSNEAWWSQQRKSIFLYFESVLEQSYKEVTDFHKKIHKGSSRRVYYSVKSNPNRFVLETLHRSGAYFDISSIIEFDALLRLGISAQKISYSGPNKSNVALIHTIENGISTIHLDNMDEWSFLSQQSNKYSMSQLTLRIPMQNAMTQKLGLPKRDLRKVLEDADSKKLTFSGFHTYLGRENFSDPPLKYIFDQCSFWVNQFPKVFPKPQLYLGAGLPQLDLFADQIPGGISETQLSQTEQSISVHLEVGRAISSACGAYATKILSIKSQRSEAIIIIDGGLQHLASKFSSPKFGETGFKVIALRNGKPIVGDEVVDFLIYGSLGVAHDRLISVSLPKELKRGDWLLFEPCGSYGITAATQQFLGLGQITEYFISKDKQIRLTPTVPSYQSSWLENHKSEKV